MENDKKLYAMPEANSPSMVPGTGITGGKLTGGKFTEGSISEAMRLLQLNSAVFKAHVTPPKHKDKPAWEAKNHWQNQLSEDAKGRAKKNKMYTEGMTYIDLWRIVGPILICRTQYEEQKTDCADTSLGRMIQFAYDYKLPFEIKGISNRDKGTPESIIKKVQVAVGAEQLFDGAGTFTMHKFTKAQYDKDPEKFIEQFTKAFSELIPGDLVTWNHMNKPAETGHNITVVDVHPDLGTLETIQGQPNKIPEFSVKHLSKMIEQVKDGSNEIEFQKWDFKKFDKQDSNAKGN